MKLAGTWIFVIIWLFNLIVGIGAGYAALRLWYSRRKPLIREIGLFMLSAAVDATAAVGLLFLARGVRLTWKFSTVLFVSAFISNLLRLPLILLVIRGHNEKVTSRGGVQLPEKENPDGQT